jgi:transposase
VTELRRRTPAEVRTFLESHNRLPALLPDPVQRQRFIDELVTAAGGRWGAAATRHPGSQDPVTTAERARILELYCAGRSLEQAARDVGRSYNTVWRVVDRAGVMRRSQDVPLTTAQQRAVIASWRERFSLRAVARHTGHPPSVVLKVLLDHNIDPTPGLGRHRDALRDHMVQLYTEEHLTVREVAAAVNRSYGTVYNALSDRGVLRSRGSTSRKVSTP